MSPTQPRERSVTSWHCGVEVMTPAQHREAMLGLSIAPDHYRKISSQADNLMRTRTAKQQLAEALAASKAAAQPPAFPAPGDGDEDDASLRNNIIGA